MKIPIPYYYIMNLNRIFTSWKITRTVASEAGHSELHPYPLEPVFSAKTPREKLPQQPFFFWYKPEERKNILNELRHIGRQHLIDKLCGKKNK